LLSKIEQGRRMAQTWICRDCLSSFGNVDDWRRQNQRGDLLAAGIGIAAALGFSVLIVRKTRSAFQSRNRLALRSGSPAFI
jgi:hypothetical protein